MKHLKKIASLLLAVVMVLTMSVATFAAYNNKDSKVDLKNHTFAAYQIFSGTFDSVNKKLTNIQWANGVPNAGADLLSEIKKISLSNMSKPFENCSNASEVAETLANYTDDSDVAKKFAVLVKGKLGTEVARGIGTVYLPNAGYYLIEDITSMTDEKGNKTDNARNLSLLEVNAATLITPRNKTDKPSLEKKVKDINDSDNNGKSEWQDSADYDIGDTIPYQLTATMGDLTNYDKYYVEFHDTMTNLTFTGIKSVKVGDIVLEKNETKKDYEENWDATNKILTISITDVKAFGATKGTKIVVEYEATLDKTANIGSDGNPNTAYLIYSNNPDNAGSGETGKTTEDKNIVFTYKVTVNKTNEKKEALPGAAFELFKKEMILDGEGNKTDNFRWKSLGVVGRNEDGTSTGETTFSWKGLDDGDYFIREVLTPVGYNSIEDKYFTVTATHDSLKDDPELTDLSGNPKTGSVITLDTTIKSGEVSTTVVNKSGSTLPETGGIGTTIFYVVGVVLMLGAGVLLITKRRMSAKH